MAEYIKENGVSVILVAVKNGDAIKDICHQIKLLGDVNVLDLYSAEMDEIKNEYLVEKRRRLQFEYQIDFDSHSKM